MKRKFEYKKAFRAHKPENHFEAGTTVMPRMELDLMEMGDVFSRFEDRQFDQRGSLAVRGVFAGLNDLKDIYDLFGGTAKRNPHIANGFSIMDMASVIAEFGIDVSVEMDNLFHEWESNTQDTSMQKEFRASLRRLYRKIRCFFINEREVMEKKQGGLAYLALSGELKDNWQDILCVNDMFNMIVWCVAEALIEGDDDLIQFWNRYVVVDLYDYKRTVYGNRYNKSEVFILVGRNLEKLMEDIFGTRCDQVLLFEYATDQFHNMSKLDDVALMQIQKRIFGLFICLFVCLFVFLFV